MHNLNDWMNELSEVLKLAVDCGGDGSKHGMRKQEPPPVVDRKDRFDRCWFCQHWKAAAASYDSEEGLVAPCSLGNEELLGPYHSCGQFSLQLILPEEENETT